MIELVPCLVLSHVDVGMMTVIVELILFMKKLKVGRRMQVNGSW